MVVDLVLIVKLIEYQTDESGKNLDLDFGYEQLHQDFCK
jgi:hypothetical protein